MTPVARSNPRAGVKDMVISMAVLLVPILVIMWFFARPGDEVARAVDYAPVLTKARAEARYPVLAPVDLPESWVPNRVRWAKTGEVWLDGQAAAANSWQLGFMSPDGAYIAVQQRDGEPKSFIAQLSRDGKPADSVVIAGLTWQRYTSSDARTRSLVATTSTMTAIVAGDVEFGALEAFAATLKG